MGPYRRDCITPYCRFHDQYGHGSEECSAKKSYASAAKRDIVESENDTEDEMEIPSAQVTKPRKSRHAYTKSKTGFTEPVTVESTPRWSRCPNQVQTASLPREPMDLPAGKLSEGETSGNGRDRRWNQKPQVLPLPSPASPNLEPLVIVEDDPDPKVLRVRQDCDPDKG